MTEKPSLDMGCMVRPPPPCPDCKPCPHIGADSTLTNFVLSLDSPAMVSEEEALAEDVARLYRDVSGLSPEMFEVIYGPRAVR